MQSSEEKLTAHFSSIVGSQCLGNPYTCSASVRTDLVQVKTPLPGICFIPLPIHEGKQITTALIVLSDSFPSTVLAELWLELQGGFAGPTCYGLGSHPQCKPQALPRLSSYPLCYALLFQASEVTLPNPLCLGPS